MTTGDDPRPVPGDAGRDRPEAAREETPAEEWEVELRADAETRAGAADRVRQRTFRRAVQGRARRRRAAEERRSSVWSYLGTFGLVGWSVTVPALLGVAVGAWADRTWETEVSFTLTGLTVGVAVGCLTAWYWVRRESERDG